MSNDLENLATSLGLNLVNSPQESEQTPEPVEEATEPIVGGVEEESNVLENTSEEVTEEPVSETQQEEVATEPASTETVATEEPQTVSFSDEDIIKAVSEMVGIDGTFSKDELIELLTSSGDEVVQELDPTVKAISDFISSTGKSADDWFMYQSFNPSEMDDLTVLKTDLQIQYPDLSDEDAQLLMEAKYKLNEDEHSENDVRLGMLQLRMDAKAARDGLEKVRESYRAPERKEVQQNSTEDVGYQSPIDDAWISNMSKTVDSMETLKFNIGDKEFSFGLDSKYKSSLKSSNADLENYFVQYVSEDGSWDFNKLSTHRAVIDNIDAIVKAVYGQGLSDGQSSVVKEAVNPSSTAPSSTSVDTASAEDKVRKQILNALRGGDDTLSIRF
jgi:hypothetical protein